MRKRATHGAPRTQTQPPAHNTDASPHVRTPTRALSRSKTPARAAELASHRSRASGRAATFAPARARISPIRRRDRTPAPPHLTPASRCRRIGAAWPPPRSSSHRQRAPHLFPTPSTASAFPRFVVAALSLPLSRLLLAAVFFFSASPPAVCRFSPFGNAHAKQRPRTERGSRKARVWHTAEPKTCLRNARCRNFCPDALV